MEHCCERFRGMNAGLNWIMHLASYLLLKIVWEVVVRAVMMGVVVGVVVVAVEARVSCWGVRCVVCTTIWEVARVGLVTTEGWEGEWLDWTDTKELCWRTLWPEVVWGRTTVTWVVIGPLPAWDWGVCRRKNMTRYLPYRIWCCTTRHDKQSSNGHSTCTVSKQHK